ncbi:Fe-S cluster assembly ATPase SufC [Candidatus Woesearchaeota archaeon]|nr:Fe-S cluster assembly ATPase SufC [Candidatus Woesearchaeota archaeon]
MLRLDNVHISVQGKSILNGISLTVNPGEIHVIMGPNGSGKSTLAYALAGHPHYVADKGTMVFHGKDLLAMTPAQRSAEGLFLAFQYPVEVPGVTLRHFLYTILKQKKGDLTPLGFRELLQKQLAALQYETQFLDRQLNVGFSGGEKKRAEVLQLMMVQPSCAILDETDSGLDIDSLKVVAGAITSLRSKTFSALIITHHPPLLSFLKPDVVHIMSNGKIVASGDMQLAHEVERDGYKKWVMGNE